MHQRFWASISRVFIPALAIGVFVVGADHAQIANAKTPQQVNNEQKKTTEPVFRVSKLSDATASLDRTDEARINDSIVTPLDSPNNDPAREESDTEKPQGPNVDRLADSSSMPRATPGLSNDTPAVLPSAKSPAAMIPVKPATSKTNRIPHPLDRAVNIAEISLQNMQSEVRDYTAILAKREEINGVVGAPTYMNVKVRCPRKNANGTTSPFSIYMKFLRPKDAAGREVIWVEGRNEGKLIVHESKGVIRFKTFHLDPTGRIAMNGQRYPIYEAGLENLIIKLIEKAERDRAAGPCKVEYREGAQINKRPCSLIELVHDQQRAPYEFHKAQVFIDDELQVPVRFAAYDWPRSPGAEPALLEEYTYYNVKVNVGLTDLDFDPKNPSYRYPNR